MDARVELAAALPIRLGYRGAGTTPADLARHKRAGLIASHSLPCLMRLIGEAKTGARPGLIRPMRATALVFAFSALALAAAAGAGTITGRASFYGEEYRGRLMANGAPFDPDALTAASWDFPLGSRIRVTHGGREVVVTITDRGPARRLRQRGRVLDLSEAAFARLAPLRNGIVSVIVAPE